MVSKSALDEATCWLNDPPFLEEMKADAVVATEAKTRATFMIENWNAKKNKKALLVKHHGPETCPNSPLSSILCTSKAAG
jgi:hypothetical protein